MRVARVGVQSIGNEHKKCKKFHKVKNMRRRRNLSRNWIILSVFWMCVCRDERFNQFDQHETLSMWLEFIHFTVRYAEKRTRNENIIYQ